MPATSITGITGITAAQPGLSAGGAFGRNAADFAASIRRTFAAHLPLYISAFAFFTASFALLSRYGHPMSAGSGLFFLEFVSVWILFWVLILALLDIVQLWRSGAPDGPAKLLLERMRARLFKGERPGNSFHAIVTLTPMLIAFSALKDNIATINPFSWDKTFAHWDRMLGFGAMPWEILQPLLGHPVISVALNFTYDLWFFLMFAILIWQVFSARGNALRIQFLLAFCFAWFFAGSVLAIVFSSAGPCYYDRLFPGPSPFAAQMAYLRGIGPDWIWSLTVQDALWTSFTTGAGQIKGISAMPSMHVTIATLLALLGWRVNRKVGIALTAFTVAILLGSVHLLWHYAVDGIAGVVLAYLCWAAAGFVAQRNSANEAI